MVRIHVYERVSGSLDLEWEHRQQALAKLCDLGTALVHRGSPAPEQVQKAVWIGDDTPDAMKAGIRRHV